MLVVVPFLLETKFCKRIDSSGVELVLPSSKQKVNLVTSVEKIHACPHIQLGRHFQGPYKENVIF
jgi:hypothetical protein